MSLGLLAVVLLLSTAATAIFWPLRAARKTRLREEGDSALEIARDSKLAELGDLELDFRIGKLSAEDYRLLNAGLRAEVVEVIRQIEASDGNGSHARRRSKRP
jgi:hypothetical protein